MGKLISKSPQSNDVFSLTNITKNSQNSIQPTNVGGQLLKSTNVEGAVEWGIGLPYITTEPTSANTDGIIIVILSSEPATRYAGYLYIITTSNS